MLEIKLYRNMDAMFIINFALFESWLKTLNSRGKISGYVQVSMLLAGHLF